MTVKTILPELLRDQRGATAVEYGLICALIVIAMLGALGSVAQETILMWNGVSEKSSEALDNAGS